MYDVVTVIRPLCKCKRISTRRSAAVPNILHKSRNVYKGPRVVL